MKSGSDMEWTREKTLILINEYRKRRGLWDMTHDDYRKKEMKNKLLNEVSTAIGGNVPTQEIEKKFHTLRTQYHREINRMKRKEPYNSKWFGFKTLQFLSSPKACRATKGRLKGDIKDTEPVTNYIIREAPHDSSAVSTSSSNNVTEEFLTIERKPAALAYEANESPLVSRNSHNALHKLIEETTKDDYEEAKSKITIKEISLPLDHHHSYSTQSATEATEQDPLQQDELQHQGHQVDDDIEHLDSIDVQDGEDDITYQTSASVGTTSHTATSTIQQHQVMPTRIIKIQRRSEACPDNNFYDDSHQQTHNYALPAGTTKRIYYQANGQQHTATILTPSSATPNTSSSVLLNNTGGSKFHSQVQNRSSLTIAQSSQLSPTLQGSPSQQQQASSIRDDFTTYGEYVANEMRFITNREILIALKHKINTALFEASMAELQK